MKRWSRMGTRANQSSRGLLLKSSSTLMKRVSTPRRRLRPYNFLLLRCVQTHLCRPILQITFISLLEWNDRFNLAGVRNHLWCRNEMIKSSGGGGNGYPPTPTPPLGELNTLLRRRRDLHHQKTLHQYHIWHLNKDAVIQVENTSACSHFLWLKHFCRRSGLMWATAHSAGDTRETTRHRSIMQICKV